MLLTFSMANDAKMARSRSRGIARARDPPPCGRRGTSSAAGAARLMCGLASAGPPGWSSALLYPGGGRGASSGAGAARLMCGLAVAGPPGWSSALLHLGPLRRSPPHRLVRGLPPPGSHAQPLLLARHVIFRHLHQLAALDHVDGSLRRGTMIARRVGDTAGQPAQVEIA